MTEKKSRYTEAQKRAIQKYRAEKDHIQVTVQKGRKDFYKAAAANKGQSLNQFAAQALDRAAQALDRAVEE